MELEPWEQETLEILRRILESGVDRGIKSNNNELLDYCLHALNTLNETIEGKL